MGVNGDGNERFRQVIPILGLRTKFQNPGIILGEKRRKRGEENLIIWLTQGSIKISEQFTACILSLYASYAS